MKTESMITGPTLFIDEEKCRNNISKMAEKASRLNLQFRPHFKTHQSLGVGRWFKDEGVSKITVSSVKMAAYFSKEWKDITIAFPINWFEIDTINRLASDIHLTLLLESIETADFLEKNLTNQVDIYVKINVGNDRTGLPPDSTDIIEQLLGKVSKSDKLVLRGFLGHAGQTYHCRGHDAIVREHEKARAIMSSLKSYFASYFPDLMISLGDTPSCSVAGNYEELDEIRPGNFVFYDLMQHQIGANQISQIAVAVACPIVSVHPERSEVVVYGGAVHLSKDRIVDKEGIIFGRLAEKKEKAWGDIIPDSFVTRLSQEHGIISVPSGDIHRYKPGDYVMVLPVHSCLTADVLPYYMTFDGTIINKLNR